MACAPVALGAPEFFEMPVFVKDTAGYYGYRIPALLETNNGAILAFCEGRKNGLSDKGDIDILLRRSSDRGSTWTQQQVVVEEGGTASIAFGNPAPVLDAETGYIHLLCCRNNDRVFHLVSTDEGVSWSLPVEITSTVKLENWGWYATGPCHGIQLKRGVHAGRLVVPCDHLNGSTGAQGAHAIYSDDHGITWQLGATAESANGIAPNETSCVELTSAGSSGDSKIYFNTRNQSGGYRGEAFSMNSGTTFSPATFSGNATFTCPIVQGSLLRFRATDEGAPSNQILFSGPCSTTRARMSVWSSFDEAFSWSAPKLIYAGPSSYSDMARTGTDNICILFENGPTDPYDTITFVRFNEAWLNAPPPPVASPWAAFWNLEERPVGQTSSTLPGAIRDVHPDHHAMHMTAQRAFPVVAGAPAFGNGAALNFPGNGGLRITDIDSADHFDFGPDDSFTVEVACRLPANSNQTGALIAKDFTANGSSWWLRVEGGKARFEICSNPVEKIVTSSVSVNDGLWHHIAAVRDAGNPAAKQLRIYVDGQLCGTVSDNTSGSLANGQDVWIGRYNTGSYPFNGAIDFARITPSALSPAGFVGSSTQFDSSNVVNPVASTTDPPPTTLELAQGIATLRVREQSTPPWLDLQLMTSDDLIHWQPVTSTKTLTPRTDGMTDRVDRVELPQGSNGRRFFRYGATTTP
ncbi:MAG: sialidase family protein [Luteolibacter sp.]